MECNSCLIDELKFEIKIEEDQDQHIYYSFIHYLQRRGIEVQFNEGILTISEAGAKELVDFCSDMNVVGVSFRLQTGDWQHITEISSILEMNWIDDIIKEESVTMYYQPIVNSNQEIFGYEILSRFLGVDGSMIYPAEIFRAAKARGRLYALDRMCRMAAVRAAAPFKNRKAFINFIPTSIYSPEHCLQSTIRLSNELGVDPTNLVFEVVETEKVEDMEHLKRILSYYKDRGFQYACDDVGEGFSTLELLEEIKPHYMKLDMKYVRDVMEDEQKQKVARLFLMKALEIGSVPLAEGIESEEEYKWFKEAGYQLFQGYFFGKPAPIPQASV